MKVEIKQTQLEFDGFAKVESAVLRFERFSGGMTEEMTRHRYFRGDAVAVLVYDPAIDRVVLQRQFRYAAHVRTGDGWLTECVAGMMEENETNCPAVERTPAHGLVCSLYSQRRSPVFGFNARMAP